MNDLIQKLKQDILVIITELDRTISKVHPDNDILFMTFMTEKMAYKKVLEMIKKYE